MPRINDNFNLAYVHARPNTVDTNGIFYVGKGRMYRARKIGRLNAHYINIVNKYGKENILVGSFDCSTEGIAFELEKGLIKCLKRMGVKLSNATLGGDGVSGYTHTEEWRSKHSAAMKGKASPTKGIPMSAEQKAKLSSAASTQEAKEKYGKVNRCRMWITDGKSNRRIRVPMVPPTGWYLGLSSKER